MVSVGQAMRQTAVESVIVRQKVWVLDKNLLTEIEEVMIGLAERVKDEVILGEHTVCKRLPVCSENEVTVESFALAGLLVIGPPTTNLSILLKDFHEGYTGDQTITATTILTLQDRYRLAVSAKVELKKEGLEFSSVKWQEREYFVGVGEFPDIRIVIPL